MISFPYQKYAYFLCSITCITIAALFVFYFNQESDPYLYVQKNLEATNLKRWLQEQENQIWDHVYSTTHISKQECEGLKKEWYDSYKRYEAELHTAETSKKPLSRTTRTLIRRVIQDFGLCSQEIPLISWNIDSFAAATDSALFINEDLFAPLPLCVQKFLIGHELQHFIHKDTSTLFIFDEFYKPSDTLHKNHPLLQLLRFQEMRADIQSALQGPEYLQGYCDFTEMISLQEENEGFTHPKNSVRFAMANKLMNHTISTITI